MANTRPPQRFELGLVMAGAISGGAYTAGVIDFLIQALDAWEDAKKKTPDEVPPHAVDIRVMSGASAGAMTAAIAAVGFNSELTPVTDVSNPPPAEENRLFDAWVRRVDIRHLLGRRDLEHRKTVVSMLDSEPLRDIALDALKGRPRATPRSYISDPLAVILTVSNLRGVPYAFKLFGDRPDTRYGMSCHMDDMWFGVSRSGKTVAGARPLDPAKAPGADWPMLAEAALASGAFPIGLQPRLLERPIAELSERYGRGPYWGGEPPRDPFRFLCVDGGLMNNEPLELARRYLSGSASRKNPRDGEKARRAVIMIDPFPNAPQFDGQWEADDRVIGVAMQMFSALVNQARFKPEELQLAEQDDVYSRFMISPSRQDADDRPIEPAMAAAILGGFGGFLHESFRRHDFQLGRRNCQAFLRRHFCLPTTNPLFSNADDANKTRFSLRDAKGAIETFMTKDGTAIPFLPVIPLCGELATPVPLPAQPRGSVVDRDALAKAIEERIEGVGGRLIDTELDSVMGSAVRWACRRYLDWSLKSTMKKKVMAKIEAELDRL